MIDLNIFLHCPELYRRPGERSIIIDHGENYARAGMVQTAHHLGRFGRRKDFAIYRLPGKKSFTNLLR